jgi:hypothetical protein
MFATSSNTNNNQTTAATHHRRMSSSDPYAHASASTTLQEKLRSLQQKLQKIQDNTTNKIELDTEKSMNKSSARSIENSISLGLGSSIKLDLDSDEELFEFENDQPTLPRSNQPNPRHSMNKTKAEAVATHHKILDPKNDKYCQGKVLSIARRLSAVLGGYYDTRAALQNPSKAQGTDNHAVKQTALALQNALPAHNVMKFDPSSDAILSAVQIAPIISDLEKRKAKQIVHISKVKSVNARKSAQRRASTSSSSATSPGSPLPDGSSPRSPAGVKFQNDLAPISSLNSSVTVAIVSNNDNSSAASSNNKAEGVAEIALSRAAVKPLAPSNLINENANVQSSDPSIDLVAAQHSIIMARRKSFSPQTPTEIGNTRKVPPPLTNFAPKITDGREEDRSSAAAAAAVIGSAPTSKRSAVIALNETSGLEVDPPKIAPSSAVIAHTEAANKYEHHSNKNSYARDQRVLAPANLSILPPTTSARASSNNSASNSTVGTPRPSITPNNIPTSSSSNSKNTEMPAFSFPRTNITISLPSSSDTSLKSAKFGQKSTVPARQPAAVSIPAPSTATLIPTPRSQPDRVTSFSSAPPQLTLQSVANASVAELLSPQARNSAMKGQTGGPARAISPLLPITADIQLIINSSRSDHTEIERLKVEFEKKTAELLRAKQNKAVTQRQLNDLDHKNTPNSRNRQIPAHNSNRGEGDQALGGPGTSRRSSIIIASRRASVDNQAKSHKANLEAVVKPAEILESRSAASSLKQKAVKKKKKKRSKNDLPAQSVNINMQDLMAAALDLHSIYRLANYHTIPHVKFMKSQLIGAEARRRSTVYHNVEGLEWSQLLRASSPGPKSAPNSPKRAQTARNSSDSVDFDPAVLYRPPKFAHTAQKEKEVEKLKHKRAKSEQVWAKKLILYKKKQEQQSREQTKGSSRERHLSNTNRSSSIAAASPAAEEESNLNDSELWALQATAAEYTKTVEIRPETFNLPLSQFNEAVENNNKASNIDESLLAIGAFLEHLEIPTVSPYKQDVALVQPIISARRCTNKAQSASNTARQSLLKAKSAKKEGKSRSGLLQSKTEPADSCIGRVCLVESAAEVKAAELVTENERDVEAERLAKLRAQQSALHRIDVMLEARRMKLEEFQLTSQIQQEQSLQRCTFQPELSSKTVKLVKQSRQKRLKQLQSKQDEIASLNKEKQILLAAINFGGSNHSSNSSATNIAGVSSGDKSPIQLPARYTELYSQHGQTQAKLARLRAMKEQALVASEQAHCTFSPDITPLSPTSRAGSYSGAAVVNGYAEKTARLRKANPNVNHKSSYQQKYIKQLALERRRADTSGRTDGEGRIIAEKGEEKSCSKSSGHDLLAEEVLLKQQNEMLALQEQLNKLKLLKPDLGNHNEEKQASVDQNNAITRVTAADAAERAKKLAHLKTRRQKALQQQNSPSILCYVDIELQPGSTGRITVHSSDHPAVLAQRFIKQYNLKEEIAPAVERIVHNQMQAVKSQQQQQH